MERDAKRMLLEYNKETKRLDDLYRCAAKQCGISAARSGIPGTRCGQRNGSSRRRRSASFDRAEADGPTPR